jgi:hypothetical protein
MPERRADAAVALVLSLGLLLLSGCTQWRYELGTRVSPDALSDTGQGLTLTEVLARLGPPARLSAEGEGYVLAWEYWQIREDTIGMSLGFLGADLASVDWGDAHMHGEFLLVTLDRQHQVTATGFARWSMSMTCWRTCPSTSGARVSWNPCRRRSTTVQGQTWARAASSAAEHPRARDSRAWNSLPALGPPRRAQLLIIT